MCSVRMFACWQFLVCERQVVFSGAIEHPHTFGSVLAQLINHALLWAHMCLERFARHRLLHNLAQPIRQRCEISFCMLCTVSTDSTVPCGSNSFEGKTSSVQLPNPWVYIDFILTRLFSKWPPEHLFSTKVGLFVRSATGRIIYSLRLQSNFTKFAWFLGVLNRIEFLSWN